MEECLISLGVSCIFHKQQLMTSFKEQAQTQNKGFASRVVSLIVVLILGLM